MIWKKIAGEWYNKGELYPNPKEGMEETPEAKAVVSEIPSNWRPVEYVSQQEFERLLGLPKTGANPRTEPSEVGSLKNQGILPQNTKECITVLYDQGNDATAIGKFTIPGTLSIQLARTDNGQIYIIESSIGIDAWDKRTPASEKNMHSSALYRALLGRFITIAEMSYEKVPRIKAGPQSAESGSILYVSQYQGPLEKPAEDPLEALEALPADWELADFISAEQFGDILGWTKGTPLMGEAVVLKTKIKRKSEHELPSGLDTVIRFTIKDNNNETLSGPFRFKENWTFKIGRMEGSGQIVILSFRTGDNAWNNLTDELRKPFLRSVYRALLGRVISIPGVSYERNGRIYRCVDTEIPETIRVPLTQRRDKPASLHKADRGPQERDIPETIEGADGRTARKLSKKVETYLWMQSLRHEIELVQEKASTAFVGYTQVDLFFLREQMKLSYLINDQGDIYIEDKVPQNSSSRQTTKAEIPKEEVYLHTDPTLIRTGPTAGRTLYHAKFRPKQNVPHVRKKHMAENEPKDTTPQPQRSFRSGQSYREGRNDFNDMVRRITGKERGTLNEAEIIEKARNHYRKVFLPRIFMSQPTKRTNRNGKVH